MTSFQPILEAAQARAGGAAALEARLPRPKTPAELRALGDDRYLSLISLRVFRAGLRHAMVDAKWPAFEEAFEGFEPRRLRMLSDEDLDLLLTDRRLIRHAAKIHAVRANAAALCEIAEQAGSFGAYLADWPGADVVGLWDDLAKRLRQMGGNSGPYFLRMSGKDTFLLSGDVGRGLQGHGVVDRPPKGKGDRRKAQAAFNDWAADSGRPLCQLSMILALSLG
ncbi:MAG: DNA-3-methyladenine glycosylase I [Alphaproteobacteria bacterium]